MALPVLLIGVRSVRADDAVPPAPPTPAPTVAPVYVPVYPAPLAQRVQTTYVPQSVALSGPFEITDVEPGEVAPNGYTAVQRPRKHLLQGGLAMLGMAYGLSALTAAIGQDTSDGSQNPVAALWIPVAGPFIELGQSSSATADVLLVGLGGVQLAGAIMLYYGLTTKQTVFVRNDLVGGLTVTPMVARGASGLSLSGHF
ncbi:MAG TPA: hypothetical protein VGG74_25795 [Kofleriaceae bacterium]